MEFLNLKQNDLKEEFNYLQNSLENDKEVDDYI
jgi:hypothetical protein